MAFRIPDVNSLGERAIPVSQRSTSGYRAGIVEGAEYDAALGTARGGEQIASLGGKVATEAEREQRQLNHLDFAAARSALLNKSVEQDGILEKDPDWRTWIGRYEETMGATAKTVSARITDPYLRRQFEIEAETVVTRGKDALKTKAFAKEADEGVAYLHGLIDTNRASAIQAPDEETRAGFIRATHDAIDGAVYRGYIKADRGVEIKKKATADYAEAYVKTLPYAEQILVLGGEVAVQPEGPPGMAPRGYLSAGLSRSINDAAERHGEDAGTLSKIAMLESGGKTDAVNPQSKASGPFQFVASTAKQYGLTDPTDPQASADAAARLLADNRRALTGALGREPTPADLYLAHQQGAQGAAALLKNPGKTAVEVLTGVYGAERAKAAVTQNGGTVDMSAGDFVKTWAQRFDAVGAGAPINVTDRSLVGNSKGTFETQSGGKGVKGEGYITPAEVAAGAKSMVRQADGNISTEKTITFEADGKFYVAPSIIGGKSYTRDAAAEATMKGQNKPLGIFDTFKDAEAFARQRSADLDAAFGGQGVLKKGPSAPANGDLRQTFDDTNAVSAGTSGGSTEAAMRPPMPQPPRGAGLVNFIPEDKRAAMLYTAQQRQFTQDSRERQAKERAQQGAASNLSIAVSRGQATYEDVESAYKADLISPSTRTHLTLELDKETEKQRRVDEAIAKVSAAGRGGPSLDPKNADDKKALNLHYGAISENWKDLPPDQVPDRAMAYAVQYGMVPDALKATIRGGLHSGDPAKGVLAADMVKRLRNANPQLIDDIGDENDMRLANLIGTYTDYGMAPEKAVQTATESLKVDKTTRESRKAEYETQRGKSAADRTFSDQRWIERQQNSVWSADPSVEPVMRAEFEELARLEFEKTGNLDASRQAALDTVNRVWGRTGVGGQNRYMKFAPEKFYGAANLAPEDNARWMNEQLVADVSKSALQDPANPLTADRLILLTDPTRTARDGRPVYRVSVKGTDGVYYAVSDAKGNALSWAPDWSTSKEAERQKAAVTGKVEAARQERQIRMAPAQPYDMPGLPGGGVAIP